MADRAEDKPLRVLVIEPYYGGSHRSFLRGLMSNTPFQYTLMDMPARKWKWRMRFAAPVVADSLRKSGERFDRVICSTFVDVAALRGLGPAWLNDVPVLTYFHENQFAYPVQEEDERDMHFALTNMTTALASDSLAFNSNFNLETFLSGTRDIARRAPDMSMDAPEERILARSRVLPPALDLGFIDIAPGQDMPAGPGRATVLWNHRWEHDKGPEEFFEVLYRLDSEGEDFSLIVLGEQFERQPPVFGEARERLAHRTLHFGYAPDRSEYARIMRQATVAVSTSRHEFFGISALEAARAGARPLLPRRLAYPELFPDEYLYPEGELLERLRNEIRNPGRLEREEALNLTEPHTWEALRKQYIDWIEGAERNI